MKLTETQIIDALNEIHSNGMLSVGVTFIHGELGEAYKKLGSLGLVTRMNPKEPGDPRAQLTEKGMEMLGKDLDRRESKELEGGFTTEDLRGVLRQTITDLRAGTIKPDKAKAVSDLAGKIIETAKIELAFAARHRLGVTNVDPVKLIKK